MVEMLASLVCSRLLASLLIKTKKIYDLQCLATYKDIFQYVYSCTFPEIYTMSEKRGIDMKSNFYILFKTYKDKQLFKQQQLAKQAKNYKAAERKEDSEFEQKPVLKFNEFNAKHKFLMKNVWRKLKKNN